MAATARPQPKTGEPDITDVLPLEQQIRQRAYQLYVLRQSDGQEGSDINDWLEAEAEILNENDVRNQVKRSPSPARP